MSFLLITITVSFQHECSSEFVKEYVSPVNIMKGRVSPIIMNFNERCVLSIINEQFHMNIIT